MKNRIIYLIVFVLFIAQGLAVKAEVRDTVNVEEFGIKPNTYENQSARMSQAIEACRERGAKVLMPDDMFFGPRELCVKSFMCRIHRQSKSVPTKLR